MTASPFDDIRALLAGLPAAQAEPAPNPTLGRLGEIAGFLKAWRGEAAVNRPICALYAGSCGRNPAGVRAALEAVAAGGAAAAAIAQATGAGLEAFDLAIDRPTGDPAIGAAMSERECAATMAFGMEALAKQPDLLLVAGLGDDEAAAADAVLAALAGEGGDDPGTARALAEAKGDPLQLLRHLGSRQIAAAAGAIAAARTQSVPVLLDGPTAYAAAAVLKAVEPRALDHCLAANARSEEEAAMLRGLGLIVVLTMDLPEDGGVAALTALQVVRAAAAVGVL